MINLKNIIFFLILITSATADNIFNRKEVAIILNVTDIKHNGSINSIVQATQNRKTGWLRTGERWEHKSKFNNARKNILIFHLLKKLNYIQEIKPSKELYDIAILFGSTEHSVRKRLEYMKKCWEKYNVRWKKIVVLSSDRTLSTSSKVQEREIINILKNAGKKPIEIEMMKYAYNNVTLNKGLNKIPVIWINATAPPGKKRATTEDSINIFLKTYHFKNEQSILAFSSNPYIGYQNKTLETYLSNTKVLVETVGPQSLEKSIDKCLDALARELYQTQIFLSTK